MDLRNNLSWNVDMNCYQYCFPKTCKCCRVYINKVRMFYVQWSMQLMHMLKKERKPKWPIRSNKKWHTKCCLSLRTTNQIECYQVKKEEEKRLKNLIIGTCKILIGGDNGLYKSIPSVIRLWAITSGSNCMTNCYCLIYCNPFVMSWLEAHLCIP